MSLHPTGHAWFAALCCAVTCAVMGCSNGIFRRPGQGQPVSLAPPPGVAEPAAILPPAAVTSPAALPSYADVDARQVQTLLATTRDENQLLKDEIAALREQLASTSGQLAIARGPTAAAVQSGRPAPFTAGPATMQATMAELAIPGVETRFDGAVVRIEVPAERLFEQGSATLLPGGNALLTQVAAEIDRVFPRHFVGIEGHVDTEPLTLASWGSAHQLTSARAATVFDFFTSRTALRQGQLFLVAHGANHPVVSNATAAGRQRNRRIELVIYPERVGSDDADAASP